MFTSGIDTANQLAAAEQAFSRSAGPGRHWHALAGEFRLHLATAEEVVATQARLRDEAEQQAEAAHRRQSDSWRSSYAPHGPSGLFPTDLPATVGTPGAA